MKKFLILLLAAVIVFSGCLAQKTVKTVVKPGDNISVDYTGSLPDGKVFDTSIEKVAIENNLFNPGRVYKPLNFTVGRGEVVQGFDEGVIGMKVGESRILTIPPEKGYGQINPKMIQIIPIIQNIPANTTFPKVFDIPISRFEAIFGTGHKKGDFVQYPETNINLTILNITNVSLSYNLKVGDQIWQSGAPWNDTVVKIDEKNITIKANVSRNATIQYLQGAPWNTTVIGLNNVNITLRHNAIPDTVIATRNMFGQVIPMKVSFNETSIIMDRNHELAGKTLIFNVTLKSIQ